jgi:hypothetical protein
MAFPSDNFDYGGGAYRLIVPAMNQRAPKPHTEAVGMWVHTPFGGNKWITDGANLHTTWTPQGGIVIVSEDDYAVFDELRNRFANLTTPWGTFYARLARLEVAPHTDGSYRGSVSFEWA